MRHSIPRSSVLTFVALVMALGSPLIAGDVAQGGVADAPIVATAGGTQAVLGGTARENAAATNGAPQVAADAARQPDPQASGAPQASAAPKGSPSTAPATRDTTMVAPAVATVDPATVAASAMCDGTSGTWRVQWSLTAVVDSIALTAMSDPVNGLTNEPVGLNVGLWGALGTGFVLPGSATVAAMAATVKLSDGSSRQENRTVQLGGPCIANGPVVECDPNNPVQLSATADQVTAVTTGRCASGEAQFFVDASDAAGNFLRYATSADSVSLLNTVRRVVAADVPPCGWRAALSLSGNSVPGNGGVLSGGMFGGSGVCIDISMTVVFQCPHRSVVTVRNGSDAALPTTFLIAGVGSQPLTVRTLAPGQSLTVVYDGASAVQMQAWLTIFDRVEWQTPRVCLTRPANPPVGTGRGVHGA